MLTVCSSAAAAPRSRPTRWAAIRPESMSPAVLSTLSKTLSPSHRIRTPRTLRSTAAQGTVTIGAGNAFEGSSDYIKDLSAQSFDLSNNSTTFNQLSANQSNPYSIEDKIYRRHRPIRTRTGSHPAGQRLRLPAQRVDELRRDPTRRGCCAGQPGLRPGRELLERPDAARRDHLWNDFRRLVGHGCGDIALRCILGHCGYHGEW